MFRGLRSGQYSLITLARKAFTLEKSGITNEYRRRTRGIGGGVEGKLYINWEMSLEYK